MRSNLYLKCTLNLICASNVNYSDQWVNTEQQTNKQARSINLWLYEVQQLSRWVGQATYPSSLRVTSRKMVTNPYMPNLVSLSDLYGLKEAPVVHWPASLQYCPWLGILPGFSHQQDPQAVVGLQNFSYWSRTIEQLNWTKSQLKKEVLNNRQLKTEPLNK